MLNGVGAGVQPRAAESVVQIFRQIAGLRTAASTVLAASLWGFPVLFSGADETLVDGA